MSKIAKISVIPKNFSKGKTLESSLSDHGMTRYPGTGITILPFRENDGSFRTALDPNCIIYKKIEDPIVRKARMEEADEKRKKLEEKTKLRLDARSDFYNYGKTGKRQSDGTTFEGVSPYKLMDGDNIFDLDDPMQAVTFAWLSVYPKIASSLEAYNAGDYPSDTAFYVKDEEAEAVQKYAKKKEFTDAVSKFNSMSLDKRKKIARLCDLPVTDDTREEVVYNMVDDFLNKKEIDKGAYKGQSSLVVFNLYASLDDDSLYKKDVIEQAFANQILRIRKGKVFEGEQEIFKSKDDLIESYLLEKNQDDILALEKKLKTKKLARV